MKPLSQWALQTLAPPCALMGEPEGECHSRLPLRRTAELVGDWKPPAKLCLHSALPGVAVWPPANPALPPSSATPWITVSVSLNGSVWGINKMLWETFDNLRKQTCFFCRHLIDSPSPSWEGTRYDLNVGQAWACHPQILPGLFFLYPSLSVCGACTHLCGCVHVFLRVCPCVHLNVGVRGECCLSSSITLHHTLETWLLGEGLLVCSRPPG